MADIRGSIGRSITTLCKYGWKRLNAKQLARPMIANDPSSDWRHVDSTDELMTNAYKGCATLGDVWDRTVRRYHNRPCMGTRDLLHGEELQREGKQLLQLELGQYRFFTYSKVSKRISNIVGWFHQAGFKKGDHAVIFAETRADWMQTAIASFKFGLPVVTAYATLGDEAILHALKECDGKVIFTTRNLLSRVARAIESCPNIHTVVYYRELHRLDGDDGYAHQDVMDLFTQIGRKLVSFDALVEANYEIPYIADKPGIDDLAMIMYTSGTTSNPKGVMLSHRNIIAATSGQGVVLGLRRRDIYIGYLPLAHIFEVCAELVVLSRGASIGYSSPLTLFDRALGIRKGTKGDCGALKPTVITCVPAVLDRIYKAVTDQVKESPQLRRELFRICFERNQKRYEEGRHTASLVDKVIFKRIRNLLGGRIRAICSGGAPLNSETQRFINTCFSCPVIQGYGLTETSGGATLSCLSDKTTGTVGPPLRTCDIRLRDWVEAGYSPYNENPQGEILIHGDNVALGYFKNEQKTAEDFITLDGKRYFVTGDIGEFRYDGSLKIIDRKKDLIKLSNGEYISLAKVETLLLTNPLIDNVCIYADSEHDYLIALVVPNVKNLEEFAQKNGIKGSLEELCSNSKLADAVTKNLASSVSGKLAQSETPKKLILCSEPWTPASGLLTDALKLKRKHIENAFKDKINQVYAEDSPTL